MLVVPASAYPGATEGFWGDLAKAHGCERVARKGEISPESRVRRSGHELLHPAHQDPSSTGPGSEAWVTVTEHGISQSFDFARVMFSRGNVTEKVRSS